MQRDKAIRGLRIAWTVMFGVMCLLLVVLWVRSYWSAVFVVGPLSEYNSFIAESNQGRVTVCYHLGGLRNGLTESRWGKHDKPLDEWQSFTPPITSRPSFSITKSNGNYFAILPYWFLTLLAGAMAAIMFLKTTWTYSLRTLLIATTLIAVVLGLVVWSLRS